MGYVTNNLAADEEIIYLGKVHWFVFAPGTFMVVAGIAFMLVNDETVIYATYGAIFILYGLYRLVAATILLITTELALTTKRVIAKTGFIRRNTTELNHGKVESFNVDQGILGRIFGFGTLGINGTGGGKTPIVDIAKPLEFRRQAMQIIDNIR